MKKTATLKQTSRFCATPLALSIAFVLALPGPAVAQSPNNALRVVSVSIAAQPLGDALNALAATSGTPIAFRQSLVAGKTAPAVSGELTVVDAVSKLLAGSGLSFAQDSAAIVIRARSAGGGESSSNIMPEVMVTAGKSYGPSDLPPAYTGGQVARGGQLGMLGNKDVMDTPFNQTSITNQRLLDSQARTLNDVMDDVPSARESLPPGYGTETFRIRGFTVAGADILLNGMPGLAPVGVVSADFAERVEVQNGPAAMLNGMPPGGSVGGSINVVTKRAGEEPLTRFTTSYASRGQLGGHLDVSRRFGADKACGARLNVSHTDGDTAVKRSSNELTSAALGVDCRTDRLRVSADLGYQKNSTDSISGFLVVPSGLALPSAPDADKLYSPSQWNLHNKDYFGMVRGEYDLSDKVTAYAAVGAHYNDSEFLFGYPTLTDDKGGYRASVSRSIYQYHDTSAQAGLRAALKTGPVDHAFNVNVSALRRDLYRGATSGATIYGNLYTGANDVPDQNLARPTTYKGSETHLNGFGISDTLSALDQRVQLTLGARSQKISVDSYRTGVYSSTYGKTVWTPAITLVVKPRDNVSLYANHIEGLQQGSIVGDSYANAGQVLKPYVSKQNEGGVKVDWGRIITTLSVFQITQQNAVANTATNTYNVDGKQRNRGVELNVFGEVARGVRLLGGATFMKGEQIRTANGTNDGLQAQGVPRMQFNLGGEWDVPAVPGLTLTGRAIYTGHQYANANNTLKLPSYHTFDIGARYKMLAYGKPLTLRADVRNVANKDYWINGGDGILGLASPRTFLLSATVDF